MSTITLTKRSERLGVVTLAGLLADLDGDRGDDIALPAGFGDCWVHSAHILVTGIATILADAVLVARGVELLVIDASANAVDHVGTEYWKKQGVDRIATTIQPRIGALVQATSGEMMRIAFAEVDTNATPTGDLNLTFRVERLRNTGP